MAVVLKRKAEVLEQELSSAYIKLKLLAYFRFKRAFTLVCTECEGMDLFAIKFNSDMTAVDAVECEVKISKQDLLRDFAKIKHVKGIEHKFYFAVPDFLVKEALDLCKGRYARYGVIQVSPSHEPLIIKRASGSMRIKSEAIKQSIARQTSELITHKQKEQEK
jgi:hypothetical protein